MFERLTDNTSRVYILAKREAEAMQYEYVGTECLVAGLILQGDGVAAKVLEAQGVTIEEVRQQIDEILGSGTYKSSGRLSFTAHARQVADLSRTIADESKDRYIDTEHLLLAIARHGDNVGVKILENLEVNLLSLPEEVRVERARRSGL